MDNFVAGEELDAVGGRDADRDIKDLRGFVVDMDLRASFRGLGTIPQGGYSAEIASEALIEYYAMKIWARLSSSYVVAYTNNLRTFQLYSPFDQDAKDYSR